MAYTNQNRDGKVLCGSDYYVPDPIIIKKIAATAEIPTKDNENFIYDISIISRANQRTDDINYDVNIFNTGLSIKPPKGYYAEIYGSQELLNAGYMLSSPVIVSQQSFEDEIVLPLYKFKDTEDIELPFRAGIMIIRECLHVHIYSPADPSLKKNEPKEKLDFSGGRNKKKSAHFF